MTEREMCVVFANNLNRIMAEKSIKQIDIVKRLHVAKGTVSAWCAGQNIPRTDKLSELLQLLQVELSDLLLEKAPANPYSADFFQTYLSLSPQAQKEVQAFIAFKKAQEPVEAPAQVSYPFSEKKPLSFPGSFDIPIVARGGPAAQISPDAVRILELNAKETDEEP